VRKLVVIGSGVAGLAAAIEAATAGADVLVLEGAADIGGASVMSGAACCLVDTPLQRSLGVADSVELALADWARVGLNNHYAAVGMDEDLDAQMARVHGSAQAVLMEHDWLAPTGSMQTLLAKLPNVDAQLRVLSAQELGTRADHFAWLKAPDGVADSFFIQLDENFHKTVDGTRRHPHNSAPVAGRP